MRLIDADELEAMVKRLIELTPTADPVTHETAIDFLSEEGWLQEHDRILTESAVKHGRWIYYEDETIEDGGRCSVCLCDQPVFWEEKTWRYVETRYCPNCGAKMDEEG